MVHPVGGFVFVAFLVAAAVSDLRTRRIPNALTATCAFTGLVAMVSLGDPLETRAGLSACAVSVAGGTVMQWLRLVGGGDVKLFAASTLWLRGDSLDAALATAVAGGVLAVFFLRRSPRRGAGSTDGGSHGLARLQLDDGPDLGRVPYGVAIAVGCLWTVFAGMSTLGGSA